MDIKNKCAEKRLLTEFSRHPHISGNTISNVMIQLDDYNKKCKFLTFMIDSRGIMLEDADLFKQLQLLANN